MTGTLTWMEPEMRQLRRPARRYDMFDDEDGNEGGEEWGEEWGARSGRRSGCAGLADGTRASANITRARGPRVSSPCEAIAVGLRDVHRDIYIRELRL